MISIARLLNGKPAPVRVETAAVEDMAPARFLQPLMQGVARSVVETDPDQLANFLETFSRIEHELSEASSQDAVLAKINEAVLAVEEYNRRATHASQAYRTELHSILSLLMETAGFLASSSGAGIEQLSSIEKSLVSASSASELKLVRNKLLGCLTLVRTETIRLKLESERMVMTLRAAVVKASAQLLPCIVGSVPDTVTGLPGASAMTQLLERTLAEGKQAVIVLFVLDKIMALNKGSGRRAGDEVLAFSGRYLGSELSQFGPLFRWNGPALALVAYPDSEIFLQLEDKVKELAHRRLEHVVKTEQGDMHFGITYCWTIQKVDLTDSAEAICGKLDKFVTTQTGWIS